MHGNVYIYEIVYLMKFIVRPIDTLTKKRIKIKVLPTKNKNP